ncbi:MAG TPA: cyclic nucleotide-binding domain-containing protein [Acidimicrobiales bacterium]|nr:cyclic nucleotide-binding domain-containing protein [Acidimicrobiales bacterium]
MFGRKATGDAEWLAGVRFFEGFSDEELARVAGLAEEIEAEPGAALTEQGRVGQECFVIVEGNAGVYVSGEHVASLSEGSMVGEMALIGHSPRNATVKAETPMVLARFDSKAFQALLDEMPKAKERVMELLNDRMK